MRLSIIVTTMLLALAGCKSAEELAGSGPISFSPAVAFHYEKYARTDLDQVIAFAVTEDGKGAYGATCYRPAFRCYVNSAREVVEQCERAYGKPCFIFADQHKIIWKNIEGWNAEDNTATALSFRRDLIESNGGDPDDPKWRTRDQRKAEYLERLMASLSKSPEYREYQKTDFHKAIVLRNSYREIEFGFAFGQESVEAAIEKALDLCWNHSHSYDYRSCELLDVNGQTAWPLHPDFVTDEMTAEWTSNASPKSDDSLTGDGRAKVKFIR